MSVQQRAQECRGGDHGATCAFVQPSLVSVGLVIGLHHDGRWKFGPVTQDLQQHRPTPSSHAVSHTPGCGVDVLDAKSSLLLPFSRLFSCPAVQQVQQGTSIKSKAPAQKPLTR